MLEASLSLRLLLGKLGDRYGRRPVLGELVWSGPGHLIFGLGGSLWMLFLGRIIGGITGGNLSTAAAYIADVSKPEERSKNFTLIGTAWSLGLILGPAAGGLLGQFSLGAPAYTAAALSFINVLVGIFILPESLPKEERDTSPMQARDFNPLVAIVEMALKARPWLALDRDMPFQLRLQWDQQHFHSFHYREILCPALACKSVTDVGRSRHYLFEFRSGPADRTSFG